MATITGRALHFVFKIPNRKQTAHFYRDILGMKVLRHEEFTEGCEAACNGEYANRWSKTMVGYGPEDTHFVIELTFNYGVKHYERGNDFRGITIQSSEILKRARQHNWPVLDGNCLEAPGGYKYFIVNEGQAQEAVLKVTLASSNLKRSIHYWRDLLNMKVLSESDKSVQLAYDDKQTRLELVDIGEEVIHAKAYGRTALSCAHQLQPSISERMEREKQKILIPLVTLPTPGKCDVRVIILADPDGHEICFVDDEAFTQLSQFEPEGDKLLDKHIARFDDKL